MLPQVWNCLQRSSLDINTACMNAFVSALIKQVSSVCVQPLSSRRAVCCLFDPNSFLVLMQHAATLHLIACH